MFGMTPKSSVTTRKRLSGPERASAAAKASVSGFQSESAASLMAHYELLSHGPVTEARRRRRVSGGKRAAVAPRMGCRSVVSLEVLLDAETALRCVLK